MQQHNDFSMPTTASRIGRPGVFLAALLGIFASACGDDGGVPIEQSAAAVPSPVADTVAEPMPIAVRPTAPGPTSSLLAQPVPEPRADEPFVDGLDVRRVALARGVREREPVDPGVRFAADAEPLYAHFELTNERGTTERNPVVVFVGPDGRDHGLIGLEVPAGAARWRTWGFSRTVTQAGDWRVELRDEEGRVLAEREFVLRSAGVSEAAEGGVGADRDYLANGPVEPSSPLAD